MSYIDINGKIGYQNMQGHTKVYGNLKLLTVPELSAAKVDGIADWVKPVVTGPTESEQLILNKGYKKSGIRSDFAVVALDNVVHNLITWNGGYDSAIKLDAAKRFAELNSLTTVDFFDINNVSNTLTIVEADEVIKAVAADYQSKFTIKQSAFVDIDNAVDQDALDLIVSPWPQSI